MFRFRLLLLILFAIVALSGCISSPVSTSTPTASTPEGTLTPTPSSVPTGTASPTPGGTDAIKAVITRYYQAVEAQNYTLAYSYLDANATTADGQKLTQQTFTKFAQSSDNQFGPVTSLDLLINSTDHTQVIMTLSRKAGLRYHAHLQVKQEGNNWKILTFDRI